MGACFLYGNGGGGGGLNFKVVGGTAQPESPKENTIWVKTDVAIPMCHFRAETNPSWAEPEGTVFITSSTVPVNTYIDVIKENPKKIAIFLQLLGCIQYSAGAWRKRDAYVYKGGVWVQFSKVITNYYLYNMGDTCDSITGGWTSTYNATVTNGTSSMTIRANGSYKAGGATTVNAIDVSDFDTLIFNGSLVSGTGFSDFVIRLMKNGTVKASVTSGANVSLDISSLTGAHTVEIYCANGQSSGRAITVSKVYLTK